MPDTNPFNKEGFFNPENSFSAIPPSILLWNRLEGRPRALDFTRALKAEVRDALWMLTKQWQMGEFTADDAGSPVFSKVHISHSKLDGYKAAGHNVQGFENDTPLEVKAEQKKIPFTRGGKEISIDTRLQMGQYWLKLYSKKRREFLTQSAIPINKDYSEEYIELYLFNELSPNSKDADYIVAHVDLWQQYAAISGRCMDGYKLYEYLQSDAHKASDNLDPMVKSQDYRNMIDECGGLFKDWFKSMYYQPAYESNDDAWLPERLEYQFECSSTSDAIQKTLKADEYYSGHLDWYAFDIQQSGTGPVKDTFTNTFIPSHIKFNGMPDTRWWKFEDGKTDFGDIKPSTTDMSKLLLIEFGLVYSNDWFLIPFTLPIGSLATIEGLTVKNNFDETIWIEGTEKKNDPGLPWSMFKLNSAQPDYSLFLAPSALKVQEGNPVEEILLIRDEMSNMVWGIETVVPTAFGKGEKGREVASRIRRFHEKLVKENSTFNDVPYAANAKISYQAMTEVPENWIPFVPVHRQGETRQIQLQRGSMLRIITGEDPADAVKIKPQTSILREGLEKTPDALPYYIHEEEVTRSGVKVSQSFQRTRWVSGEVFVWLGMKKKTGRGEGSSGLVFDQIKDIQ